MEVLGSLDRDRPGTVVKEHANEPSVIGPEELDVGSVLIKDLLEDWFLKVVLGDCGLEKDLVERGMLKNSLHPDHNLEAVESESGSESGATSCTASCMLLSGAEVEATSESRVLRIASAAEAVQR